MSASLPHCFRRSYRLASWSVNGWNHCYKGTGIKSSCCSPAPLVRPTFPNTNRLQSYAIFSLEKSIHYPRNGLQMFLRLQNSRNAYSSAGLRTETKLKESEDSHAEAEYKTIYRFSSMRYLRMISRLKIAQTLFTVGITPPMGYLYASGQITQDVAFYSMAVASFALGMLYGMSFFLRRIIGFIYLHRSGDNIKIAHMNFWGRRKELIMPVSDVVPIMDVGEKPGEILLCLSRYSTKEKLYLSLKYGQVTDPTRFAEVFGDF